MESSWLLIERLILTKDLNGETGVKTWVGRKLKIFSSYCFSCWILPNPGLRSQWVVRAQRSLGSIFNEQNSFTSNSFRRYLPREKKNLHLTVEGMDVTKKKIVRLSNSQAKSQELSSLLMTHEDDTILALVSQLVLLHCFSRSPLRHWKKSLCNRKQNNLKMLQWATKLVGFSQGVFPSTRR